MTFPAFSTSTALGALTAALVVCATTSVARAAPEDRGPYAVTEWDAGMITADGTRIRTRVLYATTAPAGPLVGIMHGNLREGRFHMELAQTFASRGVVVVLPDMPCGVGGCDHDANARQLIALLDWAAAEGGSSASRIAGRVDPERRALVGHSYGGLGSFLATASSASIDAWVGLDPVDDRDAAAAVASSLRVPSAHLMADVEGFCNGNWSDALFAATAAPHVRFTIASSGHCDPELPTDAVCALGCRSGDAATTVLFRRYTVAFILCALGMDASMTEWVSGPGIAADERGGRLTGVMRAGLDGLRCGGSMPTLDAGPVPDAGSIPGDDAGLGVTEDASTSERADAATTALVDASGATASDTGPGLDAGAVPVIDAGAGGGADAGNDPGTTGGGCACRVGQQTVRAPVALMSLSLASTLLLRPRRRRRSL